MNRDIKFRAWSFHNKEMYPDKSPAPAPYHFQIYGNGNIGYYPTFESDDLMSFYTDTEPEDDKMKIAVMQYTGLKDKNGKEIYEGDILKRNDGVEKHVFYNEKMGGFYTQFDNKAGFIDPISYAMDRECEVIGNIYENPT